jgi:hypothetical protein
MFKVLDDFCDIIVPCLKFGSLTGSNHGCQRTLVGQELVESSQAKQRDFVVL